MKNKVFGVLIGLLLILNIFLFFKISKQDTKVVYIDTAKMLENVNDFKSLKEQILADKNKIKAKLDTLDLEFQNQLKSHEKASANMTTKEKGLSEQLLRNKQQQYAQYQQAVQEKLAQEERKKTQEILTKINAKIAEYGEEKGYNLILTSSNGTIAYGSKGVDISEDVIKVLNKK
jgi:outer membrane protein